MQAGIQLNQAQDVPVLNLDDDAFSGETENITSLATSLGYGQEQLDHDGLKVRATAIGSKVSGKSAEHGQNANGVFLEAGFRKGRYRNELGTYAAEPGLHFGDGLLLANNREHTGASTGKAPASMPVGAWTLNKPIRQKAQGRLPPNVLA